MVKRILTGTILDNSDDTVKGHRTKIPVILLINKTFMLKMKKAFHRGAGGYEHTGKRQNQIIEDGPMECLYNLRAELMEISAALFILDMFDSVPINTPHN
ncbi:hypothetical protein ACJX0J_038634 [Zea mays]